MHITKNIYNKNLHINREWINYSFPLYTYIYSFTTLANIPLIKLGELSPPYFFAISIASLIATLPGTSLT